MEQLTFRTYREEEPSILVFDHPIQRSRTRCETHGSPSISFLEKEQLEH